MINGLLSIVLCFLIYKGLNWLWNKIFRKKGDPNGIDRNLR